jgi:uncharacterized protein YqeY
MIKENLDALIMSAMKSGSKTELNVYRMIKTKFMESSTAKGAKPMTDDIEISLIRNMIKTRQVSAQTYKECNRIDLEEIEMSEINILQTFLPIEVSEDQIRKVIEGSEIEFKMTNMGTLIKLVKERYPLVDGRKASEIVKSYLL